MEKKRKIQQCLLSLESLLSMFFMEICTKSLLKLVKDFQVLVNGINQNQNSTRNSYLVHSNIHEIKFKQVILAKCFH